jgi:hypothetical protein
MAEQNNDIHKLLNSLINAEEEEKISKILDDIDLLQLKADQIKVKNV